MCPLRAMYSKEKPSMITILRLFSYNDQKLCTQSGLLIYLLFMPLYTITILCIYTLTPCSPLSFFYLYQYKYCGYIVPVGLCDSNSIKDPEAWISKSFNFHGGLLQRVIVSLSRFPVDSVRELRMVFNQVLSVQVR